MYIYYFISAIFGGYMIFRATTVQDTFLKIMLFATGGVLILRGLPADLSLALSILLYPLLILALIVFVMIRYFRETTRLGLPITQLCAMLICAASLLITRSFNWKMYAYISLLSPIVVIYAHKKGLLKSFKEYSLIMIVLGADSIAYSFRNLLHEAFFIYI